MRLAEMNAAQAPDNMRAATWYAANLGSPVFPVHSIRGGRCTCGKACSSPGKHPLTTNGVKDATLDPELIATWWQNLPWANIGIATGHTFFALDEDGAEGRDALHVLEAKHGKIPDTVESLTGGGGRHILFKMPDFKIGNSASSIASGLDIRGRGGYIVAPRSLHISGRRYEWEASSRPDEIPVAPAPTWLLDKLRRSNNTRGKALPSSAWKELSEGVAEGGRNNAITRVAGHLFRRYVNPTLTLQLLLGFNESFCVPPLDMDEVVRTVNSVASLELRRRQGGGHRGK